MLANRRKPRISLTYSPLFWQSSAVLFVTEGCDCSHSPPSPGTRKGMGEGAPS
jgi:hypothetical protein